MKKVSILILLLLICVFSLSMFNNGILEKTEAEEVITIRMIADFLKTKKEHYPLSDEFVERYQQTDGGYLDNAKKAGILVDKQLHSPNQKWHFFESWLYPSIEDGTLSWDESAENRVYTKLLCPELLLWIYEACGVNPSKVRAAKEVAEEGKVAAVAVTTIAKNMRAIVSWEDLKQGILNGGSDNPIEPAVTYSVTVNNQEGVTIVGLEEKYEVGRTVNFTVGITDSTKQIDQVKVNNEVINAVSGKNYKFAMPDCDVVITVTLKEKSVFTPTESGTVAQYNIKYDLGTRKTAKELTTVDEIISALELVGDKSNIIDSIGAFELVYGGGNGGSDPNKWVSGNMLKVGTASKSGSLTFKLNTEVNCIKITGYVHKSSCTVTVGSISMKCKDIMNVIDKNVLEGEQTATLTINFDTTSEVTISVNTAIYITGIEFIYNVE